ITAYKGATLLVSTSNGIWQYDLQTNRETPLQDSNGTFFSDKRRVLSILYLNGRMTYSTEDGYYSFDGHHPTKRYPDGGQQLMIYVHVVDEGKVYLATKGRGIVVLTYSGIRRIDVELCLGSNTVHQMF